MRMAEPSERTQNDDDSTTVQSVSSDADTLAHK